MRRTRLHVGRSGGSGQRLSSHCAGLAVAGLTAAAPVTVAVLSLLSIHPQPSADQTRLLCSSGLPKTEAGGSSHCATGDCQCRKAIQHWQQEVSRAGTACTSLASLTWLPAASLIAVMCPFGLQEILPVLLAPSRTTRLGGSSSSSPSHSSHSSSSSSSSANRHTHSCSADSALLSICTTPRAAGTLLEAGQCLAQCERGGRAGRPCSSRR